MVEFQRILSGGFSLEKMFQADFEGTDGIKGYVYSHWNDVR